VPGVTCCRSSLPKVAHTACLCSASETLPRCILASLDPDLHEPDGADTVTVHELLHSNHLIPHQYVRTCRKHVRAFFQLVTYPLQARSGPCTLTICSNPDYVCTALCKHAGMIVLTRSIPAHAQQAAATLGAAQKVVCLLRLGQLAAVQHFACAGLMHPDGVLLQSMICSLAILRI
jgi:hypothetical protein